MKRRSFLKRVFASIATVGSLHTARAKPSRQHLIQVTPINGMQYYQVAAVIQQISYDDEVILKREPNNPHDRNAIEIYWQHAKLGYIPLMGNSALARLIDQGEPVTGIIANIDSKKLPYAGLDIEIYLGVD